MRKTSTLLLSAFLVIFIVSCQKEVSSDNSSTGTNGPTGATSGNTGSAFSILGDWKFVSLQAKTTTTTEVSTGSMITKSVGEADYTTINNGGTMNISTTALTTKDMTYTANSITRASTYQNGVLTNTASIPLVATVPPFNGTSPYTRVSADFIYFPSGAMFSGGFSGASQPSGARISVSQNTLLITQELFQNQTNPGNQGSSSVKATTIVTFKR